MSVEQLTMVAKLSTVPPMSKLVLYALAVDSNGAGLAEPNIDQLVQLTGLSKRAVQTIMRRLEKQGFVEVKLRGRQPNLYTLTLDGPAS